MGLAQPRVRFAGAWRVLFLLPWAIPEFVGATAWLLILHPDRGFLAQLAGGSLPWHEHPELAWLVPLLVGLWVGFPLMMLVTFAGLRTIPETLHEAAALDGAGRWQRFRHVTLPLLMPLLAPALLIRGIAAFNQFYVFYVLGAMGGAIPATLATFSFFVFNPSGSGLLALSAAINILTIVGLAVLVAWFLRWRAGAERFLEA
jgi:arabinogalactan oligomer/maltooligosaccharide transport system permease protein